METLNLPSIEDAALKLDGRVPLKLTPDGAAWRVMSGAVDVFAQHPPGGRRHFLFRVGVGDMLFGTTEQHVGLIAVAPQEAIVTPCHAMPTALADSETWMRRWSETVASQPEGWLATAAPGMLDLHAGQGIRFDSAALVTVHTGAALLWGRAPVDQKAVLGPGCWLLVQAEARLEITPLPEPGPADIALFHSGAAAVLAAGLRTGAIEAAATDARRRAIDNRGLSRALASLAAAVTGRPVHVDAEPDDDAEAQDPVQRALRVQFALLAAHWDADAAKAYGPERAEPVTKRAERVLALQGAGWRMVRIDPAFRAAEAPPLLVWTGDAGEPGVLAWRGGGWQHWSEGSWKKLTEPMLATMSDEGIQIYPLPRARSLRFRDLIGQSLIGARGDAVRAIGAAMMVAMVGAAAPFLLYSIVETALPRGGGQLLWVLIGAMAAVVLTQTAFDLVQRLAVNRLSARMEAGMQPVVIRRLMRLPLGFFATAPTGEILDRALGLNAARQVLSTSAATLALSAPLAFAGLVPLFFFDTGLAALGLALAMVTAVLLLAVSLPQARADRRVAEAQGRLEGFVLQLVQGVAKLRVAAAEDRAMTRWSAGQIELLGHRRWSQRWQAIRVVAGDFLVQATTVCILAGVVFRNGIGDVSAQTGPLPVSPAEFIAFSVALAQVTGGLVAAALALSDVAEAMALAARARPLLATELPSTTDRVRPPPLTGRIDVRRVTFRYAPDAPPALDDVSLTIEPGHLVALVGPSGCGKSTLVRLLLGFERPDNGDILYDDLPTERLDLDALRDQIGTVLQHGKLSAGTLQDNIVGDRALGPHEAWTVARLVGLDRDIEKMPMGMHTVILDGGGTLSGGQRQRVLIARALAGSPRVVIFDEATSALDNRTQSVVMQSLRGLAVTRIVVAHRLSTIQNADMIHVLVNGRIVESGRFAELAAADGPFSRQVSRQML